MTEIALDDVGKRFADGTHAVRGASFTVRDGEFFILVGPSGCGKSTLLNMIVGLETPSAGEIRVDGQRVNEIDARGRNMAMVFQSYALYPHMSVRENLSFPLEVAGMKRARIGERVGRAAALLELEELLDRRPAALSGGQRQRVAMGRAIVREPAAFLLDEPLSNLDARLRGQMRTEIARLQKRLGTTTIYVTHDQTEAMVLGDRVAVLRAGVVQQVGTPRELYESPRNLFVASFIGAPGMNFLPARIDGRRLVLPMASMNFDDLPGDLGALDRALARRSRSVIAGVRPEHLHDAALAGDRTLGPAFRARVEVLEWMGSESYVHFAIADAQAGSRLGELAHGLDLRRGADGRIPTVARVGAESAAAEDREIDLVLDAAHLHLFDPDTGERLVGRAAA